MQAGIPIVKLEQIKVYSCKECDKVYPTEDLLVEHGQCHEQQQYINRPGMLDHFKSAFVKLKRVNIFQCGACDRAFIDLHLFQDHQAIAHRKQKPKEITNIDDSNNNELKKPYKCEDCGLRFVAKSTLIAHDAVHAPMYTCSCGIAYYKQSDLKAHRRLVHPTEKTWKPKIKFTGRKYLSDESNASETDCDSDISVIVPNSDISPKKLIKPRLKAELVTKKKTKKKPKLKKDREITVCKENLNGPPYQCSECPKNFIKFSTYKHHLIIHSDKAVKCHDCGKLFSYKKNLEVHMVVHTGQKPYPCEICMKSFTQTSTLHNHIKSVHANLKSLKCKICGKGFNIPEHLKRHEVIHSGILPYVCTYKECGKGFADPSALSRHIRTHTGECRYFCKQCPAAYTDYSAYARHTDRVHLNKRYPCKLCGKKLSDPHSLKVHMQIQHGIGKQERFECNYCLKEFPMKNYLVLHIRRNHIISKIGKKVNKKEVKRKKESIIKKKEK